jgi:hypothetical protein
MATTNFLWVISSLDCAVESEGLPNVINVIHYRYQAEQVDGDKTYNAEVYGAMGCATPSDTDFTAYDDLTFDQVCEWLVAGNNVEAMELNLDTQIENLKNPPIVNLPLPWNK